MCIHIYVPVHFRRRWWIFLRRGRRRNGGTGRLYDVRCRCIYDYVHVVVLLSEKVLGACVIWDVYMLCLCVLLCSCACACTQEELNTHTHLDTQSINPILLCSCMHAHVYVQRHGMYVCIGTRDAKNKNHQDECMRCVCKCHSVFVWTNILHAHIYEYTYTVLDGGKKKDFRKQWCVCVYYCICMYWISSYGILSSIHWNVLMRVYYHTGIFTCVNAWVYGASLHTYICVLWCESTTSIA